jgi:membrane-associated HD superfamily phosphohydrolase
MKITTNNKLAILSPFGFCIAFSFYFMLSFYLSVEVRNILWYGIFFGLIISLIYIDKSKLSKQVRKTYNIGLTSTMIVLYIFVIIKYLHITLFTPLWNMIFWFGIIFMLMIFSLFLYRKIDNDLYLKN